MITSKSVFIETLRMELVRRNVSEVRDILLDFDQHFADGDAAGETEAQVCEKLGDPAEIAKQYACESGNEAASEDKKAEENQPQADASGFGAEPQQPAGHQEPPSPPPVQQGAPFPPPPIAQPKSSTPDAGRIVGLLCLDAFVFSWAIPTLLSLLVALYSVCVSIVISGIVSFFGGALMNFADITNWFVTPFSALTTILFGLMLMSGGGLLVLVSINATKGFINIILRIINSHSRAFVGKDICKLIGKRAKAE